MTEYQTTKLHITKLNFFPKAPCKPVPLSPRSRRAVSPPKKDLLLTKQAHKKKQDILSNNSDIKRGEGKKKGILRLITPPPSRTFPPGGRPVSYEPSLSLIRSRPRKRQDNLDKVRSALTKQLPSFSTAHPPQTTKPMITNFTKITTLI